MVIVRNEVIETPRNLKAVLLYMCPHAAKYVSSCCSICVLMLLYMPSYFCICGGGGGGNEGAQKLAKDEKTKASTKSCGLTVASCPCVDLHTVSSTVWAWLLDRGSMA